MASPEAKFVITAEDKTKAAIESAIKRLEGMESGLVSLKGVASGVFTGFIGAEVLSIFSEGVVGAIDLGDEMGKLATKTGLTAAAASELSNVFRQNDLDNEALTNSFKKMQVSLSKNSDIFKQLGLDVASLKAKNADEAFELIAQRISEIPNAADRARAAVEIFGKTGSDLLPILNLGADGIRDMRKELGGLSNSDVQKLQEADDAIKKLGFLNRAFWNNVAIGVVTVSEALGLLDKPAKIKSSEDLNKLLNERSEILKDIDKIGADTGGIGDWQTAALKSRRIDLAAVEEKINAVNESLLAMDKTSEKAADTQGGLDESLSNVISSLSEVSISVDRAKSATQDWNDVQSEFYKSVTAGYKTMASQQLELSNGLQDFANKGISDLSLPEVTVPDMASQGEAYSNMLSALHIYVEDVKLSYSEMNNAVDAQLQAGLISERQAAEARIAIAKMERDSRLEAASTLFGGLSSLMSTHSRRSFEIGKAAAIANATISAGQAIMNAYATQPWYLGLAQGVSAAAMLYSQIDQIKSVKFSGYQSGGYTGSGSVSEVAGVVHRQEYVMDAASTARIGRGNLDAMRSGRGAGANINIHNNNGSAVEARQLSSGEIEIMIDHAINKKTPRLVSAEVSNPNSTISKAISRSTKTVRNR